MGATVVSAGTAASGIKGLALHRALHFTLRRDFVIDNFEGASRLKRCWPAVVCWPKPLELGCDRATQQSTGLLCLRPIMDKQAVEHHDIGGHPLRQLRVIEEGCHSWAWG